MNTPEQSEKIRQRLEAISDMVNQSLENHAIRGRVGIKSEPNIYDICPVCDCPLRLKYGRVNGYQRYKCAVCGKQYFGEEVE